MCIALCFGCKLEDSQTIKDITMESNDTSKVIIEPSVSNTNVEALATNEEKFDDFLEKFKNDLTFRKNRVKSPIILYKGDEPTKKHPDGFLPIEVEFEELLINEKEWEDKVNYKVVQKSPSEILLLIEGVDVYIKMEYKFKLEDGKWLMDSFKDMAI